MSLTASKTADVTLVRSEYSDQGVFGALRAGDFVCHSGELPWRDNRPGLSCVPRGRYLVGRAWSPHLRRETYRLVGVPGRSGILIHPSNLMGDASLGYRAQLRGCISLSERLGVMDGQRALLLSAPAVRRLEEVMRAQPFILEIRDA